MTINLTMLGQLISFVMFVLFCMKFVWPPLTQAMRERQKALAEGLEKAVLAEKQLELANDAAAVELDAAKKQSAELIAQARQRANQIVEEAKGQATEEADRIKLGAQSEIDQEVNRARESLRARVSELAIQGAERILESSVDQARHQEMLNKLAAQL
ncbi:MAG: F0F1 ATP synthase subunit B [SAR86 cluster bacterium]|uniref:ATP synthase subunit b n=1 Tax=SAR86 cluster bacterium TaxID=2030880 RepID=A0A973A947_9GAMM|nr:F0F1 ATP synthase subunit B [SAR86 cluster bacterium]